MFAAKHTDADDLFNSMTNKYFYYTRTRGLFRVCFPKERPPLNAGKFYVDSIFYQKLQ